MAVDVKTLLTLFVLISILQNVCVVSINRNLNKSRITKSAVWSNKNDGLILLRVKKAAVKVGTCSLGKEYFQGKCRTQQEIQQVLDNDYGEIVTEAPLYEVVPLRNQRPKAEKNYVSTTEVNIKTSVTLPDVPNLTDLDGTENTSDINDMKVHAVSPSLIFKEDKTVKMNNVTYVVLIVCGCAFVLTWLIKVLYDSYLRRDDDTALFSCSTDDMLASTSSRTGLCSTYKPNVVK